MASTPPAPSGLVTNAVVVSATCPTSTPRRAKTGKAEPSPAERDARRRRRRRRGRYELREVLWGVSALKRVCGCGRWRRGDKAAVEVLRRDDGTAYFDGTQTCGSPWACPVCAAKIRQRRADEIERGLLRHLANGGGVLTQVLTLPHDAGDSLAGTFGTVTKGWRRLLSGRAGERMKAELGIVGTIKSTEPTHGPNGWHPHLHVLWLLERPPTKADAARLESHVYARWAAFVEKAGYRRPMQRWCHVEPIRDASDVAGYVTKISSDSQWDVPLEMTRHDLKEGRTDDETRAGHRTPWQILRDYARTGDERDRALWLEYERTTHRKHPVTWSKGLKNRLEVAERTDDELAEEEQGGASVILLADSEWSAITRTPGAACRVLETAEKGDPAEVRALIAEIAREALERQRAGP